MQHFWGQDKWTDALQGGQNRCDLSTWVAAWLTNGHWPGQRHYPCKCIHFETLRRCYKQFASFQSTRIAPAAEFWTLYSVYCILDSLANRSRNPYSLPIPGQARLDFDSIIHAISIICRQASLSFAASGCHDHPAILPSHHPAIRPSSRCICISASGHLNLVSA